MTADRGERHNPLLVALGKELRVARERHAMTQQELARRLHFSDSQISAVETGKRAPRDALVVRADEILETGGLLERLLNAAQDCHGHESTFAPSHRWREIEETATVLRSYQPLVFDPLLRTAAYARALAGATPLLTESAAVQEETNSGGDAPRLIAIIEEAVLLRPIGGDDVMRDQLGHLAEIADSSRAEIHIIPTDTGAHNGLAGGFVLASRPGEPDVAHLDTLLEGCLIENTSQVDDIRRTWEGLLGESYSRHLSRKLLVARRRLDEGPAAVP